MARGSKNAGLQLGLALGPVVALVDDPLAWLAPLVLGANELCMVHRGDLDGARSSVTSGSHAAFSHDYRFQVNDARVTWSRGDREGTVTVKALVEHAARRRDPVVGDALCDAYRAYVRAATSTYTLARRSPDYLADPAGNETRAAAAIDARRALSRAADAWWSAADPPGAQFALF